MKAIVAVNNLDYIGKDGKMLWRSSDDFKHFKKLTIGEVEAPFQNILIVGAKTFENDLRGKELPGRKTIVIGSKYNSPLDAIDHALSLASHYSIKIDIWIIGGKTIYDQFAPFIEEWHISHIDDDSIGDVKFELPALNRAKVYDYYFKTNPKD